jgi:hypothetical protein
MVTLTRNLDFAGSCFLTGLTAIFVAGLCQAPAWKVRALSLLVGRHHRFSFLKFCYQSLWSLRCRCFAFLSLGVRSRFAHYDLFGRSTWSPRKSICKTYENCDRKPKSTNLRIVSAGRADGDAVIFIKGIGDNLKTLAVHFYVHGRAEAEVLHLDAAIGANLHCIPPSPRLGLPAGNSPTIPRRPFRHGRSIFVHCPRCSPFSLKLPSQGRPSLFRPPL